MGLSTSLLLLPGPVTIARGLTLDVHAMLVASACCVVGVQSVCFAIIARDYATVGELLPPSPGYQPLSGQIALKRMLILGADVFAAGE